MALNTATSMATNFNRSESTLTIIFGCLATVLALAGIIVTCVQYRSYNRTSDSTSSPSSLEAGLPLAPIIPSGRQQEQGESDSAPKNGDVGVPSTPSNSDITRAGYDHTRPDRVCSGLEHDPGFDRIGLPCKSLVEGGLILRSDLAVLTGGPGLHERSMSILRSLADELRAGRPYVKDDDV